MFAFLRGTVAHKGVHRIALDVQGVGYDVSVPNLVLQRLNVHQEVTLLTYCHIREESFQIFGFLKEEEKSLFESLLSVSGVGPKVALAVLSVLGVRAFGQAVLESDVAAVSKAPGVGKKLAQRIILELKAKMGQDTELSALLGETEGSQEPEGDDVFDALIALGCTPPEAKKAMQTARKQLGDEASDEDLVRAALRTLARTR